MIRARFRWAAVAAVGMLLTAGPSFAQNDKPSPAAVATAKEILEVKGSAQLFDPVVPGVIEQVRQMFMQSNPTVGKDLGEVAAKLTKDEAKRVDEVRDSLYQQYASRFTEAELKDMLAFYKTPLGKKMITEEPKVLEESMNSAEAFAQRFTTEIIEKTRAEMKKRGHDL